MGSKWATPDAECDCGDDAWTHHKKKDHYNGEGACNKCACTWFHPRYKWRPANWNNPHIDRWAKESGHPDSIYEPSFEAGADAMYDAFHLHFLETMQKWANGEASFGWMCGQLNVNFYEFREILDKGCSYILLPPLEEESND